MAEIINLRRARKRKAREEQAAAARENSRKHGISRKVREIGEQVETLAKRQLDGKKLDHQPSNDQSTEQPD